MGHHELAGTRAESSTERLTHSQTQIWIGQQLSPESPLYNMAFAWVLEAELDPERMLRAWQKVADRSDALRTVIVTDGGAGAEALVRIRDRGPAMQVLESSWDDDGEESFLRWCRDRCARPFPLGERWVDSVLVPLGKGRTGWYLNLHHLVTDAWSTALLFRQVAAEHQALGGSETVAPEPLKPYYPTAAALAGKAAGREAAARHWEIRRESGDSFPAFYGRRARPESTASKRYTLTLDRETSGRLLQLCGADGFASLSAEMSRFALFSTLLLAWLHRVGGGHRLRFDAPVAGRPSADAKRALGLFIEMFPFAVDLEPGETFRSLGAKCLEEAQLFLCHALPGTSMPSGGSGGRVVLNFVPVSFGDFGEIPARVEWVHPGHGDRAHALRLQVHDFGDTGETTLHFDWNREVLSDRLCHRSLEHFEALLQAMLTDPDQPLAGVDVRTAEERQSLAALNDTARSPLPEQTVVERFLARVEAEGEQTALAQGSREVSFAELGRQVETLAATLRREGVEIGDRVAVLSRRSVEAVVGILATLRVGAAYVPIDPAYPPGRIALIFSSCGARVLLLGDRPGEVLPPLGDGARAVSVAEVLRAGEVERLDLPMPALGDLAYVLYTSGSTGRPKGVLIEHGGLAEYLEWAERQYVRGERLAFALFTSLSFDLTVTSLFLPLLTGGRLEIYPEPEGPVDSALVDVARSDVVDFVKLTPSHLSLLLQMDLEGSRIRRMVVGGEDFKTALATAIQERIGPELEITNEYGPTEAVVGCVAHRFDPANDAHRVRVPIGRPADHVTMAILEGGMVVPEGVAGELWVSRPGLARGYLGLEELTAERFLPDPQQPARRWYRTGDRVRQIDPDTLEYLGRVDRQLKISGFRVEPAEIEAALLAQPEIESCVVVARRRPEVEPARPVAEQPCCVRCGLPSDHPRAVFDADGVCSVCRSYEKVRDHAQGYFRSMEDLRAIFRETRRAREAAGRAASYDCLMLYSGGKDSTYALCQLVEMGLSVYAFTLDNGFISEDAKRNIRRVAEQLGVEVELATTPAMNAIFRDSLERFDNVCQGCFKTIYTLSTRRARELGIPIVVTGLSRGQMFETRLTEEMFREGHRSPEEVDAAVLAARKVYHRLDDEVSRSLDVEIFRDDRIFEEVRFVDFYRYCDVDLAEVYAYLLEKVPWVRPEDTGRSTNCLINDLGIYLHKKRRGYHNYALPYSWDVRMGHKTRSEALAELDDEIDLHQVRRILAEIGGDPDEVGAAGGPPRLAAFYVASEDLPGEDLRQRLAEILPAQMIPSHLQRIDEIPLTAHGKVDEAALPEIAVRTGVSESVYRPPEGPVAERIAELWSEQLGIETIGTGDSFFELGGTSLGAMEVMLGLCREFDLDLPLETLFSHPTLGRLARVAEDRILADVAAMDAEDPEAG